MLLLLLLLGSAALRLLRPSPGECWQVLVPLVPWVVLRSELIIIVRDSARYHRHTAPLSLVTDKLTVHSCTTTIGSRYMQGQKSSDGEVFDPEKARNAMANSDK